MFIQLTVVLSLLVQVCSQSPYDTSFGRITPIIEVSKVSQYFAADMFSNGDLLAGGWSGGLVGYPTSGYENDYLLQRYKADGTLVWTKVLNSNTANDKITAVKVGADDSIYAVGYSFAGWGGDFDGHPLVARDDATFAKFDSAGNKIFTGLLGGDQVDQATGVAVDEARGVFYVVGNSASSSFNGVPLLSGHNGFLVTVDSTSGAVLSTKRILAGANYKSIVVDGAGALWVCGTVGIAYFSTTPFGDADMFLQKLTPSGDNLLVSRIGKNAEDTADFLAVDAANNLYTAGVSLSGQFNGETNMGRSDMLITKHSNAGVKLWARVYGGTDLEYSTGISVNSQYNRVYITGYTHSTNFEGVATPGGNSQAGKPNWPCLLVLDATTGARIFAQVYITGGGSSSGGGIISRGYNTYMTGFTVDSILGLPNHGTAAFVLGLQGDEIPPTPAPSAAPSFEPTASPTAVCMQWALGDYGESCSTTCSKLSRTCKDKYLKEIVNQESFYAIVGSAVSVRSGGYVGTAETFCSQTTDSAVKVGGPAALSIVLSSEDHHLPVRTSCTYPTSTAEATLGCDAVLPLHNYRRFCPCVDHNCDGAWYLGYSGDSCDATCTSAGGVCDAEPLNDIVNPDAFSAMVASATVVETNEIIGESSAAYCHEGINILPLAPAPSVITLTFGSTNETLCAYPTSVSNLQGSCDMAFTDLPAQRFCSCKVTGPASHPHRMLLAAGTAEPAAVQPQMAVPTPRLRGKAFQV